MPEFPALVQRKRHEMTNEMIIFNNRIELMKQGVIKGTGQHITVENEKGEKIELEEPEELHTYRGWQELRKKKKKGEKAVATFLIWKHTVKKTEEDEEKEKEKMFMTKAFFFTVGQTEPIKEEK